jgi:hypothetical protein
MVEVKFDFDSYRLKMPRKKKFTERVTSTISMEKWQHDWALEHTTRENPDISAVMRQLIIDKKNEEELAKKNRG